MTRKFTVITFLAAALVVGFFVTLANSAGTAFETALVAYRGVSAVNAALVLSAAADIAAGKDPAVMDGYFAAALARENEVLTVLTAARPWWAIASGSATVKLAENEAQALSGAANAVQKLAALPKSDWSGTVADLQNQTRAFSDAHEALFRK